MKKGNMAALLLSMLLLAAGWGKGGLEVRAASENTIKTGIFADSVELSGMTEEEATQAINDYVESLKSVQVILLAANNREVVTTAGALGITWTNTGLVQEALDIGKHGNVIQRYKVMKDLENDSLVYDVVFEFDVTAINNILVNECARYNQDAVNVSLKRENGVFQVVEGQTGYKLDVETDRL